MMKCIIIDDDEMIIATLEHYISQTEGMELVKSFTSAIEGANFYKQNKDIDLILLDVEMPEMTGLDFLNVMESKTNVVLVTSKPEYAVQAFEYAVKDYILKPVQYSRFLKAVEKCKESKEDIISSVEGSENEYEVYIRSDLKYVRLNILDVKYIEAQADYVSFVINDNTKHMVHATMKSLEQKLPAHAFVRIHRSYIVNIKQIDSAENAIVNVGSASLPIGASYRTAFFDKLKLF